MGCVAPCSTVGLGKRSWAYIMNESDIIYRRGDKSYCSLAVPSCVLDFDYVWCFHGEVWGAT